MNDGNCLVDKTLGGLQISRTSNIKEIGLYIEADQYNGILSPDRNDTQCSCSKVCGTGISCVKIEISVIVFQKKMIYGREIIIWL